MRFVVVEIPDNDEAEAFVEAIKRGDVMYTVPVEPLVEGTKEFRVQTGEGWKVPQMYAVPTKFCDCPDYAGKSARSAKYGWYVHAKCAKPRPTNYIHPYNLIEGAGTDPRDRIYTMSFRANRKPWRHEDERR